MSKRKTTKKEKDILIYLNELRDSGLTNMYSADVYLDEEFKDIPENILQAWMKNYNKEGDYDYIKD